ncbi:MAG: hypothetical protein ACYDCK_03405 [Thermoplasmatota archaeon]
MLALVAPHAAASHPDSSTQPVADGCTRDPGGLLAGTAPEWVYVNHDPAPKYVRGTVVESHPAGADLFRTHTGYDADTTLALDPAYADFAATANLAEENGALAIEWQESVLPTWAWPAPNDTLEVMGSWIWDCGHWGQGPTDPGYFIPGVAPIEPPVVGEDTEIHPPRMFVVHHAASDVAADGASVADAIISSDGTLARATADHAEGACTAPLADMCPTWTAVNDRDYSFDIAAPSPPPPGATIAWRVEDEGSANAPAEIVTANATGIHVVVPFHGWGHDGDAMRFSKRFFVTWIGATTPPRTHVRVTLDRLTWLSELDGPQSSLVCPPDLPCTANPQMSAPPDEVVLYVEAAGIWQRVDSSALLAAHPGDIIPLTTSFDAYLPMGAALTVDGVARECDMPGLIECPVPTEAGFNDAAGSFAATLGDASSASGAHTIAGTSNDCETSTHSACYQLAYHVAIVDGAANHATLTPWFLPFGGLVVAAVVLAARKW